MMPDYMHTSKEKCFWCIKQSKLFIKSQVQKTVSSNTLTVSVSDLTDVTVHLVPFDADRYSISQKNKWH